MRQSSLAGSIHPEDHPPATGDEYSENRLRSSSRNRDSRERNSSRGKGCGHWNLYAFLVLNSTHSNLPHSPTYKNHTAVRPAQVRPPATVPSLHDRAGHSAPSHRFATE